MRWRSSECVETPQGLRMQGQSAAPAEPQDLSARRASPGDEPSVDEGGDGEHDAEACGEPEYGSRRNLRLEQEDSPDKTTRHRKTKSAEPKPACHRLLHCRLTGSFLFVIP